MLQKDGDNNELMRLMILFEQPLKYLLNERKEHVS